MPQQKGKTKEQNKTAKQNSKLINKMSQEKEQTKQNTTTKGKKRTKQKSTHTQNMFVSCLTCIVRLFAFAFATGAMRRRHGPRNSNL